MSVIGPMCGRWLCGRSHQLRGSLSYLSQYRRLVDCKVGFCKLPLRAGRVGMRAKWKQQNRATWNGGTNS